MTSHRVYICISIRLS